MVKKLEREAKIALWTLKVIPLQVIVKSDPTPVLRRLEYDQSELENGGSTLLLRKPHNKLQLSNVYWWWLWLERGDPLVTRHY